MTIDVEEVQAGRRMRQLRSADPVEDDDALLALARSRMLAYLALAALPGSARSIVPVGSGVVGRASRGPSGLVTLLETDGSTFAERTEARNADLYRRRSARQRLDMLTGLIPGTDVIIGMSRRLFTACRNLAALQADLAATVDAELPMQYDEDLQQDALDERSNERHRLYWEHEEAIVPLARDAVRRGFALGRGASWENLLDQETPMRTDAPAGFLEAATEDTYLAVDARTVRAEAQ
ncbi:hypothetical protein [Micromonospora globispora]|uniref:hypothetical protein n=1 Tax=Micromonospora globispora TaxID=1450148 RepID=UPI000F5EC924|nr:hypothetical protein [Micromonospora globispora]